MADLFVEPRRHHGADHPHPQDGDPQQRVGPQDRAVEEVPQHDLRPGDTGSSPINRSNQQRIFENRGGALQPSQQGGLAFSHASLAGRVRLV